MTKKHFIKLADMIRSFNHNKLEGEQGFSLYQLQSLAEFCRQVNPRFKANRWLDYIAGNCGPGGGAIKKGS